MSDFMLYCMMYENIIIFTRTFGMKGRITMAIRVCCKDEIFLYNDFIAVREKLLSLAKEAGDVLKVSVELDGGSYSLSASENAELKSLRIHFSASAGE